ncbi:unnamed protein product [Notodromas monacha]|uniref:Rhodanese domain-containing protein n=1 Tax=Notodromas monacha TaxID=399045 RepID=A0A7R9G9E2_9CRUS|nr:unnamed protein product [Notodromas monacha]CAG0912784.1 unnamed protein product [Notodromas monacha]
MMRVGKSGQVTVTVMSAVVSLLLSLVPQLTSSDMMEDLFANATSLMDSLAAEARRTQAGPVGEDIVVVGTGTVNIDPREFLLRQFPHLAKRLFGSAFTNYTSTTSTTTTTEKSLGTSSTTQSPPITTSTRKLSELLTTEASVNHQDSGGGERNKFSMIIKDLSDDGNKGPRPGRISLLPFGSPYLPEFSSGEDARKSVVNNSHEFSTPPSLSSGSGFVTSSTPSSSSSSSTTSSSSSSSVEGEKEEEGESLTRDALDGAPCNVTEVDYETLKDGLETGDLLMIDIRPRLEAELTGIIPGSLNIPSEKVRAELDADELLFERRHRYRKPHPKLGPKLVLTSREESNLVNVVRQLQAAGYANLMLYPRGLVDWILRGGRTERIFESEYQFQSSEEDEAPVQPLDPEELFLGDGQQAAESRTIFRAMGAEQVHENDLDYLSYDDLKFALNQRETLLIDVRRREAFKRGSIPGAVNLPLHMITFDATMTPSRFHQKYNFNLPSKHALRNVIVFGRDRYDGIGAVKRFRVVGYKICQVYNGYDDWMKNYAEDVRRGTPGLDHAQVASGVGSSLNFVSRPPSEGFSPGYVATTPDPKISFRSAASDGPAPLLPNKLGREDVQILVLGGDPERLRRAVRNLRDIGYRYVYVHVAEEASDGTWKPMTGDRLQKCLTLPTRTSAGSNQINAGNNFQRTATSLEKFDSLNFQTAHEHHQQKLVEKTAPTTPAAPASDNKLKVVKEEIFFKDLLEKMEKGEYKVFEFRSEDSVRKDGKIPKSAVMKLFEIPGVVTMQDKEFVSKFGFRKPALDGSDLVVSCDDPQTGREAIRRLRQLGYSRAALFSGCFQQWKSLGGPVQYPTPSRISPGELALQVRKGAMIIDVGDLKLEGRDAFPKSINIPDSNKINSMISELKGDLYIVKIAINNINHEQQEDNCNLDTLALALEDNLTAITPTNYSNKINSMISELKGDLYIVKIAINNINHEQQEDNCNLDTLALALEDNLTAITPTNCSPNFP